MAKPANRLDRMPPYVFAELERQAAAARRAGVDVIDLGIGDPDLPTPEHIIKAAQAALADPVHHRYPPNRGLAALREAAAEYYRRRHHVTLDPDREVLILIGSKEGLAHIAWAHLDPGEVALVPDPGYPVYRSASLVAGAETIAVRLDPDRDYLPDLAACALNPAIGRAKLLFLNYPHNPTGAVLHPSDIPGLLSWCRERDILLVHDLAYAEMTFDGYESPSVLSVPGAKDCAIEFYSLSKPYNMTGWRVAFCCGNERAINALAKLKSVVDSSQCGALQMAGAKALLETPPAVLQSINDVYRGRRDLLWQGLNKLGLTCRRPLATFYLWAAVTESTDDLEFAAALLDQAGVVVSPGSAFGTTGRGHIRLALTLPEARLAEAIERISRVV